MKNLIALLLLVPFVSHGIKPVIFSLDSTNTTYTVPANKVFLIGTICTREAMNIRIDLSVRGLPAAGRALARC